MTTLTNTAPALPRDRYGRPLVIPPGGGKPVAYSRCTSFIDVIDDKFNLQQWEKRMVALGLADRPDLMLAISAHRDDKRALSRICDEAKEAARGSAAATTGTALHALTEVIDRGQDLPVLPDSARADLEAYREATTALRAVHIERFCVLDTMKVGGTPDRIVEVGGELYIADLKTGSIEWGTLKIAAQLAVYARSYLYDVTTGERTVHGASTNHGIVIHLPAGQAKCELHWIDLEAGWEAVKTAKQVRDHRALKFKDLTEPFTGTVPESSIRRDRLESQHTEKSAQARRELLEARILACAAPEDVRQLWANHEAEWDDHLTEVARAHINKLPAA